ncbi:chemosensory receptor A [Elysia marginata]|uniref:Chemosensory receptor A n=1 Tax=Elysia marginata TaxID=1093978 RepID=A0AAV4H227_9GAST|nr:chemosensory receptor A [Elysia marginata]
MEMPLNLTLNSSFELTTQPQSTVLYIKERLWTLKVLTPLSLFIMLFGFISNLINIVVFSKAGIKDNVTTLLCSLAVTDLTFLILAMPNACFWFIYAWVKNHTWPFHYAFAATFFYWPAFTAFDLSVFISVSLGVMRCACVAMPLKFKIVFTKSRTIKWVLFLVVLAVCLRIPVLTVHRVARRYNPVTNSSYVYVVASNDVSMFKVNDIMNRGFFIWFNFIVMVSCVCVLSFKLNQASKIRRSYTKQSSHLSDQDKAVATTGMSPKDMQVVKSVVLVCSIFIFTQLPYLFVSTTRLLDPQFTGKGRLDGLFGTINTVGRTCSFLNASVNILVYYNFNSKYRCSLLSLFEAKRQL